MILYELWEKKRPFDELNSKFDIIDAIKSGKRPKLSENYLPTFKSLIERCWDGEPTRYSLNHCSLFVNNDLLYRF